MGAPCIICVAINGSLPNAGLLKRTAEILTKHDRPVATPTQARDILGMPH